MAQELPIRPRVACWVDWHRFSESTRRLKPLNRNSNYIKRQPATDKASIVALLGSSLAFGGGFSSCTGRRPWLLARYVSCFSRLTLENISFAQSSSLIWVTSFLIFSSWVRASLHFLLAASCFRWTRLGWKLRFSFRWRLSFLHDLGFFVSRGCNFFIGLGFL